jgi:recombination protein RecR
VLTDQNECEICQNPVRDHSQIMVVKDTKDVISIEKSRQYNGLYHVLGGLISPLDGIGPDDINLETLAKRAEDPSVKEIIIATSFTPAGETTALYIDKIVARPGLTVTKIGYGLPAGGDIEYADELTLRRALEARKKI